MTAGCPSGASSSVSTVADRLIGWKAIAGHLAVSVRTAQRWAHDENLPIHRHMHAKLGTVYAYDAELEAWWVGRPAPEEQLPGAAAGVATSPSSPPASAPPRPARER